jgi:hypothetical protein
MRGKNSKKITNDFITESYKLMQEKVNNISKKLDEINIIDEEPNSEEENIIKNWGGYGEPEEEFDAFEFFGDAGDAAESDIKSDPNYGEEEFASFGTMEDPRMLKSLNEKELRAEIIEALKESGYPPLDGGETAAGGPGSGLNDANDNETVGESYLEEEEGIDEERIANPDSKIDINNLDNFIGSHIYGEDLGDLGKMYVAYSYGEQFPLYLNYKGKWYHNSDSYILDDKKVNKATEKHKKDMRPSSKTIGTSLLGMQSMIRTFKNKNNLGDNNHTDVEPGIKN